MLVAGVAELPGRVVGVLQLEGDAGLPPGHGDAAAAAAGYQDRVATDGVRRRLALVRGGRSFGQQQDAVGLVVRPEAELHLAGLAMASAAQFVQALVVFLAVAQGLFASMNQALVGAMFGAGLARDRETVQTATLLGILKGWAISPLTGGTLCYVLYKLMALVVGG